MDRFKLQADMQAKLAATGLPHESITVFGAIRCNVHVRCLGIETAEKWGSLLSSVFKGARVHVRPYAWDAAKNKGTSMRPTKRHGYLVAVAS